MDELVSLREKTGSDNTIRYYHILTSILTYNTVQMYEDYEYKNKPVDKYDNCMDSLYNM